MATAGRLHRETVAFGHAKPVETVVMKMNVRYPRDNKNNRNLFKDSSYLF
ncbi:hypothetical protein GL4_0322 [Methyloceanibacter caenitepidi]|uniref:Uncharacterized protein n=2 Tax=Methyloceanibacter caenitepidi TaxID=1384459 RepID=A0A0A8JZM1_9HYPH|nr:hypothetical protein GL4_0322 [Methyloceanibacter caenitepidi]